MVQVTIMTYFSVAMESEDGVTVAVKAFFKHLPQELQPQTPPPPSGLIEHLFDSVRRCLGSYGFSGCNDA